MSDFLRFSSAEGSLDNPEKGLFQSVFSAHTPNRIPSNLPVRSFLFRCCCCPVCK